MRAILKICGAAFRKNRIRNLINLITFMLAALIFTVGIAMLSMSQEPFDRTFDKLNTSHKLIYCGDNSYDTDDIARFWKGREEVENVSMLDMFTLQGKVGINGETIDTYLVLCEYPKDDDRNRVMVIEGTEELGENEIWISTQFAYDNNIKVGSFLSTPVKNGVEDYKVTAIVVDPHYCVGVNNPSRAWVAKGELKRNFTDETGKLIGLRYKQYSDAQEDELWAAFEQHLGKAYQGICKDYRTLVKEYRSSYSSIGAVMITLSAIIILFCCVIISYIISYSISEDYVTIGVLKSEGFSTGQIIGSYVFQYLIMIWIAVPIGGFLSFGTIKALSDSITKTLGVVSDNSMYIGALAVSFIVFTLIVALVTMRASIKIGKIKPSQAIRYGAPAEEVRECKFKIRDRKYLGTKLQLSIQDLLSKKKHSLIVAFAFLITGLILSFAYTTTNTYKEILFDPGLVGWDESEFSLSNSHRTSATDSELEEILDKEDIECWVPIQFISTGTIKFDDSLTRTVMGYAYGGDMDSVSVKNYVGTNPHEDNEISVGSRLAHRVGKTIGDTIEVDFGEYKKAFVITGIFETLNNDGYLYRIKQTALEEKDRLNDVYQIVLKEGTDKDTYRKHLVEAYGDAFDIQDNEKFVEKKFGNLMMLINLIAVLVSFIITIVCIVSIYNLNNTDISGSKRIFGIYKTFGMSYRQIRNIIMNKNILCGVVGAVIGIIVGYFGTGFIIKGIMSGIGLYHVVITDKVAPLLIVVLICVLLSIFSTLFSTRKIAQINPRNLIID